MSTPRVFLIRHGETEWSLDGRHTGLTDIPLTSNGEKRVRATGKALVGPDRLIAPKKIAHIYVSPRKRAQRTFELLNLGLKRPLPWTPHGAPDGTGLQCEAEVEVTDYIREWDYGDYEGITTPEIQEIRERYHKPAMDKGSDQCGDVLLVAHGHILRAFAMRWAGYALREGPTFLLEAGGVGTLSYEHHRIEEPALLLGGAFVVELDGQD
ncbi:Histidine phosphatase superfamily, clade-1 [Fusarium oxysporum f. sp. vasinfectum]|nr:Histidine phosphatase superfamily, clade-1 [Fusarium oxysporum f. sp. vasinfectum]